MLVESITCDYCLWRHMIPDEVICEPHETFPHMVEHWKAHGEDHSAFRLITKGRHLITADLRKNPDYPLEAHRLPEPEPDTLRQLHERIDWLETQTHMVVWAIAAIALIATVAVLVFPS